MTVSVAGVRGEPGGIPATGFQQLLCPEALPSPLSSRASDLRVAARLALSPPQVTGAPHLARFREMWDSAGLPFKPLAGPITLYG
jgi:hypothetical protein